MADFRRKNYLHKPHDTLLIGAIVDVTDLTSGDDACSSGSKSKFPSVNFDCFKYNSKMFRDRK